MIASLAAGVEPSISRSVRNVSLGRSGFDLKLFQDEGIVFIEARTADEGRFMKKMYFVLAVLLLTFSVSAAARAEDRHTGYYYPEHGAIEVYEARAGTLPQADRALRIAFVTGITNQNASHPYPPQAVIFAKGDQAQKLIIVALVDGRIDTVFRARAEFANMTAAARLLPAFREMGVQDQFTFFDLAKMLGFEQITISNGRDFAHQVLIK